MNTQTDPIKISAFLSNSRKDSWSSVIFTPFQGNNSIDERLFGLISLSSVSDLDCLKYGEILRGYIFPKFYEVEADSLIEKLEYTISSVENELRSLLRSKKTEDHNIDLNIFLGTIFEDKLYLASLGDYKLEIYRRENSQELNSFLKAATHGSKVKVASMTLEEQDILIAYSPNLHEKVLDIKFNSCFSKFNFETLDHTPLKTDNQRINILQIGYLMPEIVMPDKKIIKEFRTNPEFVKREEPQAHIPMQMRSVPNDNGSTHKDILPNISQDFLEDSNDSNLEQIASDKFAKRNEHDFAHEYEKDNFPPRDLSYEILYGKRRPQIENINRNIYIGANDMNNHAPTSETQHFIQDRFGANIQETNIDGYKLSQNMDMGQNVDIFAQNIKTRESIYKNIPKPNLPPKFKESKSNGISVVSIIISKAQQVMSRMNSIVSSIIDKIKNRQTKRFEEQVMGPVIDRNLSDELSENRISNSRFHNNLNKPSFDISTAASAVASIRTKLPFISNLSLNKKLLPLVLLVLLIIAGIILNLVNRENQRRAEEALLTKNTQILNEAKSLLTRAEAASLTARADIKTSLSQATTKFNQVKQSQIASLQDEVQKGLSKVTELTDSKVERNIILNEGSVSFTDLQSSFPAIQVSGLEVIGDKVYVADRAGNIYEGTFDTATNKYGFINILTTKLPGTTIEKIVKDLSGNLLIYSTLDGIYRLNVTDKSLTKLNEFNSGNLGAVVSMLSYDLGGTEFLYYLDQQNSSLKRSSKDGNNYSAPSARITNDAFKQSTDFDIDGKVWVCTNTLIKRFFDGKEEVFSYDLTQFNTQPGTIQNIALDDTYVYASDSQNSRIIITNKGNPLEGGVVKYVGNLIFKTKDIARFDTILDMKISNGYIYILDSKRVYRWKITIPTIYL